MVEKISDRTPLRYPGGKYRARKILSDFVPSTVETVLSPFLGGGSFELFLTSKGIAVDGFDKFNVLANFWEVLCSDPVGLATEVDKFVGKVSSDNFKLLQKVLSDLDSGNVLHNDLDVAVKFFVVNRCSFSGATLSGGFSKESAKSRFTKSSVDRLRSWKNSSLTAQYGDAFDILSGNVSQYDLIFLDPPYFLEAEKNKLYGVKGNAHQNFDHKLLRDLVGSLNTPVLLTYNNSKEVRDLYAGFNLIETSWAYGMNASKKSSELVIKNY